MRATRTINMVSKPLSKHVIRTIGGKLYLCAFRGEQELRKEISLGTAFKLTHYEGRR